MCILKNEILTYDVDQGTVKSYGVGGSISDQSLSLSDFGITNVKSIYCFAKNNQLIVLSSKKASTQVEKDTTEVYLFMGGRRLDVYTILR